MRIESADVGLTTTDLRALLRVYEETDRKTVESLLSTNRARNVGKVATKYRGAVTPGFLQYVGCEGGAKTVPRMVAAGASITASSVSESVWDTVTTPRSTILPRP